MDPHCYSGGGEAEISRCAFIVGAPRCGTTFIARHLQKHPDVCFSKVKEPHFFSATDLRDLSDDQLRREVRSSYLDRFFPHRAGHPLLAEGSVTYLYTPLQLEPVLRLWPNCKFIIALRDPMQMVPSLHQRLRCIGDETVRDFEQAWALVQARRQGRAIPRRCVEPRWLDYWESGRLGHYLEQFFRCVGRDRCFISLFDDLISDPAGQYRRILEFLELPDDHQSDFKPERQSSGFRFPWLQRLLKRPPSVALSILGSEAHQFRFSNGHKRHGRSLSKTILAARKRLIQWNRTPAPPVQLSARVQADIRARFRDDVRSLERIISRDLSHWLSTPPSIGNAR